MGSGRTFSLAIQSTLNMHGQHIGAEITAPLSIIFSHLVHFCFSAGRTDGCTTANSGNMKMRSDSSLFARSLAYIIKTFIKPF